MVFYGNGIGDAIINRPALSALGKLLPGPVRLICNSGRGEFLWRGLPFDETVTLSMEPDELGIRAFDLSLIPRRYDGCEVFATMVPWFSPSLDALVARLSPSRSYGMGAGFDVTLPLDYGKNSVELGFDVVRAAAGQHDIAGYRLPLAFDSQCERRVDRLLRGLFDLGYQHLISVHTETLETKQWSHACIEEVLCRVLERSEDLMAVMVDYRPPERMCACHEHRIIRLPGLMLENAMRIVTLSDLFFGIDSCMLHAADHAGVPGVVLFGPETEAYEFGYYWTSADHLKFVHRDDRAPIVLAIDAISRRLDALGEGVASARVAERIG